MSRPRREYHPAARGAWTLQLFRQFFFAPTHPISICSRFAYRIDIVLYPGLNAFYFEGTRRDIIFILTPTDGQPSHMALQKFFLFSVSSSQGHPWRSFFHACLKVLACGGSIGFIIAAKSCSSASTIE